MANNTAKKGASYTRQNTVTYYYRMPSAARAMGPVGRSPVNNSQKDFYFLQTEKCANAVFFPTIVQGREASACFAFSQASPRASQREAVLFIGHSLNFVGVVKFSREKHSLRNCLNL